MTARLPRSTILKWALGGVVFGLAFPAIGAILAGGGVVDAHRSQPVLYVVDLAPLVLGLAGAVIGVRTARLELYGSDAEALADRRLIDLEAANRRLVDLLDTRAEYVGRIVEELRVPVAVLVGLVQRLPAPSDAAGDDALQVLDAEVHRLGRVVDDLWVSAQEQSSDLPVNPKRFELSSLVREVHGALRPHVDVEASVDLSPVPVFADPKCVTQIARNLIVNADLHGGQHVSIRTLIQDGEGVFEVRDDGEPLSPEQRVSIFEPYARSGGASRHRGIGLGLTVARRLAQRMGGNLTYDHFGGWAIFKVRLPMAPAAHDRERIQRFADDPQLSAPTKSTWRHAS